MRSYRQYCGLARALDAVGDRWTLLIVRELLVLGPCRYSDLRDGLPGIATNMLADRLREMEAMGLIERIEPSPPIATPRFGLTDRGRALKPVIHALGAWAGPTLDSWQRGDEFRTHWLALPLELHLVDRAPQRTPVSIEIRTGDGLLSIEAVDGAIRVKPGAATKPDAIVSGPPDVVLSTLLGRLSLATARRRGLRTEGDSQLLGRLQPVSGTD